MPMERLSMRKIREVLRLKYECHLNYTKIGESCHISRESVRKYLMRAEQAKLNWPLPEEMDDEQLERLLFPYDYQEPKTPLPDMKYVHQELKRKGVTRWVLWEEYKCHQPDGVGYSQFCDLYRRFIQMIDPVMRQTHKAGEKLFVDYAGMTIPWIDATTGEVFHAQVFVAVMGASNYTYVEATETQGLEDWISSHVRTFKYLGGVPYIVVPDNLLSGVTKAHLYDPEINFTYQDMANHYGIAIIPARVAKPKDKAKVEVGVQGIERFILAKLRNMTFFSVTQINTAIKPLLEEYNKKPFQKMPGNRGLAFEEIDKPSLKALPAHPYEYAQWKKVRAGIDYHVAHEHHYYSVPYHYIKHELDLRITSTLIQCFYKNKCIATHVRSYRKGHTTLKEHMPKNHQEYAQWTPERLFHWAKQYGHSVEKFIQAIIDARVVPQQAFRACLGVLCLGKQYGATRLDKACLRALTLGAISYKNVESILKNNLDQKPLTASPTEKNSTLLIHDNLRGPHYYYQ